MMIAGGIIGGKRPSVLMVDEIETGQDVGGTYTFNNRPLGPADPSRILVLGFVAFHAGTNNSLVSSVGLGGVSAAFVTGVTTPNLSFSLHLWAAHVPSGDTGTITIARGADMIGVAAVLWAIYNARSATPVGAEYSTGTPEVAIDMPIKSGAVCVGFAEILSSSNIVWTGLTEDTEAAITGSSSHYGAASADRLSGSSLIVGASGGTLRLAAASWR